MSDEDNKKDTVLREPGKAFHPLYALKPMSGSSIINDRLFYIFMACSIVCILFETPLFVIYAPCLTVMVWNFLTKTEEPVDSTMQEIELFVTEKILSRDELKEVSKNARINSLKIGIISCENTRYEP